MLYARKKIIYNWLTQIWASLILAKKNHLKRIFSSELREDLRKYCDHRNSQDHSQDCITILSRLCLAKDKIQKSNQADQ